MIDANIFIQWFLSSLEFQNDYRKFYSSLLPILISFFTCGAFQSHSSLKFFLLQLIKIYVCSKFLFADSLSKLLFKTNQQCLKVICSKLRCNRELIVTPQIYWRVRHWNRWHLKISQNLDPLFFKSFLFILYLWGLFK